MRLRPVVLALALAAAAAVGAPAAGAATAMGPCPLSSPLPATRPPIALRFGITPQAAGSAGAGQAQVAPEDEGKALAALHGLQVPGRELVVRLNRLFQSDGAAGIAHFEQLADHYAAQGFAVELQVRYHPATAQDGDVAAFVAFVRQAVRAFAPRPAVVALSITNEANLVASPNTSDGFYTNNVAALVQGITAAREEADRLGRPDLRLGFTYAYRFVDDEAFFDAIGRASTPAFTHALDYVGLQAYPGLVFPPPGVEPAGQAVVDGANLLRSCLFPRAGIGDRTKIWVTENGYASHRGDDPAVAAAELRDTLDALASVSGTLGITDYRYFNLRDNDSTGSDLFAAVGLLYDDYARKPSYDVLAQAIARDGATAPGAGSAPATTPEPEPAPKPACVARRIVLVPHLRRGERIRSFTVGVRGGRAMAVHRIRHRRAVALRLTGAAVGARARLTLRVRTTLGRRLLLRRLERPC